MAGEMEVQKVKIYGSFVPVYRTMEEHAPWQPNLKIKFPGDEIAYPPPQPMNEICERVGSVVRQMGSADSTGEAAVPVDTFSCLFSVVVNLGTMVDQKSYCILRELVNDNGFVQDAQRDPNHKKWKRQIESQQSTPRDYWLARLGCSDFFSDDNIKLWICDPSVFPSRMQKITRQEWFELFGFSNSQDSTECGERLPWVCLFTKLRNRFTHRGVYLLESDIDQMKSSFDCGNESKVSIIVHNFFKKILEKIDALPGLEICLQN